MNECECLEEFEDHDEKGFCTKCPCIKFEAGREENRISEINDIRNAEIEARKMFSPGIAPVKHLDEEKRG